VKTFSTHVNPAIQMVMLIAVDVQRTSPCFNFIFSILIKKIKKQKKKTKNVSLLVTTLLHRSKSSLWIHGTCNLEYESTLRWEYSGYTFSYYPGFPCGLDSLQDASPLIIECIQQIFNIGCVLTYTY